LKGKIDNFLKRARLQIEKTWSGTKTLMMTSTRMTLSSSYALLWLLNNMRNHLNFIKFIQ
jgi:hypothetical protein